VEAPTVEEMLRRVEERAAMLRFFADGTTTSIEPPSARAWSGLADVCEEIESAARNVRKSLDAGALNRPTQSVRGKEC